MQSYIVTFRAGTTQQVIDEAAKAVTAQGGSVGHRYTTVLLGF